MELPYLIDGIEEDEDLRLFFYLLIKVFEYCPNNILVHVALICCDLVVIFDSLKSDFLSFEVMLNNVIDVEFNDILNMLFVEAGELLLHRGRTSYDIRSMGFTNL